MINYFQINLNLIIWSGCSVIIPVRCFSCGKLIAHTYKPYLELIEKGESAEQAFKQLEIERFCCKRMIVNVSAEALTA